MRKTEFDLTEFLKTGRSIRIRAVALMDNLRWFGTSRERVPASKIREYVEPIKDDARKLMRLKGLPVEKINQLKELIFTLDDLADIYSTAENGHPRDYDVIQRSKEAVRLINTIRSPYDRFVKDTMIPAVG